MNELQRDLHEILDRTPVDDRRVRRDRATRSAFRKVEELEARYGELPAWVREEILRWR